MRPPGLNIDLAELIRLAIADALSDVYTSEACIVESYDGATCTVDVTPIVQRTIDDENGIACFEDLPIVPNVPVAFPQAGPVKVTWPIAKGDEGVIFCSSQSLNGFQASGERGPAGDQRRMHLGSAVFLPFAVSKKTVDPDNEGQGGVAAYVVRADELRLGSMNATDFAALAGKVDDGFAAIRSTFNGHSHASLGGGPSAVIAPVPSVACAKVKIE